MILMYFCTNITRSFSSSGSDTMMQSSETGLVKHKIFLSHAGAQKDFVEQLCEDLEARGYFYPFFDRREQSLPKGKDFAPLIKEAAQLCEVAVVVLSEEFLCSKWPMIELAEFYAAQQAGNQRLNMLPLFYKLSVDDLRDQSIERRWMPKWREYANDDKRIDLAKWSAAVRALRKVNGVIFHKKAMSEVAYRKDVVRSIFRLSPPELLYGSSRDMLGYSRICQVCEGSFILLSRNVVCYASSRIGSRCSYLMTLGDHELFLQLKSHGCGKNEQKYM
jgi:hypothetical protein